MLADLTSVGWNGYWSGGGIDPRRIAAVARARRGHRMPVKRKPAVQQRMLLPTTIACALATAGCSIAGSWRTVSTEPPGVTFPINTLTLDGDGNYTATWIVKDETRTDTGFYRWDGFTLDVEQAGSMPRSYGARLRLNGNLLLTHRQGNARAVATLVKTQE